MFECIRYLLLGIMFFVNIQGKKNESYIWRIAGLNDPHLMQLDSTGQKIISCRQYEIFKILKDKLDFRYEVVKPVPNSFGRKEKNGTWTGMAGQVASNKADITIVPFFITYDRFQSLDFPASVEFHQVQFIVKTGGYESNWNSIIRPFSFELWVAVITLTILFGILLRQVLKYETSNETTLFPSFSTVIWYLFGSLTFQGGDLSKIYRLPSRFSIAIWLLSVVILVSSYSGTLMSFMTSPVFEFVPTTFEELAFSVQNGKFACGTFKGEAISAFLMGSKSGNGRILADHMISNNNFGNAEELTERVLKEKFAFFAGHVVLTKIQKSNGFGKLLISDDAFVTFSASYGLRKRFPYKQDLDKILSRLFQSGIVSHLGNHGRSVGMQTDSEIRSLTIEDFLSPFALLLIGYIISFSCLIIEIIIAKQIAIMNSAKEKV